jgi:hypothetical protein
MTSEILIEKFKSLSSKDKKEVLDFIEFLKTRKANPRKYGQNAIVNIEDEKFIGMWKNRPDMEDSTAWVRNHRKTEWVD